MRFVRLQRFCSWRYPAFGDESHGFGSVMTVHRSCILGGFGTTCGCCGAHAECGDFYRRFVASCRLDLSTVYKVYCLP